MGVAMLWDLCLVDPTPTKPTCSEMACGGTCSCQQTRQYSFCTQRSPRSRMAMKKGKSLHGLSSTRGHLHPNPHQWALLFPGSSQGGQRVGEKKKLFRSHPLSMKLQRIRREVSVLSALEIVLTSERPHWDISINAHRLPKGAILDNPPHIARTP